MFASVLAPLLATGTGRLLVALVVLALVVLVGRLVLSVAWKLLLVAIAVVAALYVVSLFGF